MLTQLSTLKTRLRIDQFDLQYDAILTSAIKGASQRFEKECNRTLARTVGVTEEFTGDETEIRVACYPIETITKLELKSNDTEGWVEQTGTDYLLRQRCVISLAAPLGTFREQGRVTFTGGLVLSRGTPRAGPNTLPA